MLKDRLKEARKAAGLTQKQVAIELGITESTYCGYETGKREPDALKISRIAKVLGVTGDYLLETGFDEIKKPTSTNEDGLDDLDNEIVELLKKISGDQKRLILAQLKVLTEGR